MTEGLSEENRALLDRVWGPALLVGFDATGPAILTPHGLNRLLDSARAEGPAPPGGGGLSPKQAWQDLLDKDDRTSPAEYPEMALITFEELADYMAAALTKGADRG